MILAVILAILMLVPFIFSAFNAYGASTASNLEKLRARAAELQQEKGKLNDELSKIQSSKQSALQRKMTLDKQIDVAEQEIDNSNQLIDSLTAEIKEKEVQLADAIEAEKEELRLYKKRVRAMEESGTASYIGILVQADSFDDLLGRVEIIGDVLEYDQQVIARLKSTRQLIADTKTGLENDRTEQSSEKTVLEARKAELDAQYKQSEQFVAALETEQHEYEAALREALKAEDSLDNEIKSLLARQAAEKAAAEAAARKAEAARKAAQQSGGGGGNSASSSGGSGGATRVGTGSFSWPLPGYTNVTSGFKMRYHPILKVNKMHTGIDLPAPTGTKIKASDSGTVVTAGYNTGYGNYVVINHGGGKATLYGHMSRILCSVGQKVDKLDTIGAVGSTGFSTGSHLHFEIIINGKQVNPLNYF